MSDGDVDQATLKLIVELQLQDAESLTKGKHREGDAAPDADLALGLYRSDLQTLAEFASDKAMCQSISLAVIQDGDAIAEHTATEQQVARDHELARRLNQTPNAPAVLDFPSEPAKIMGLDDELLSKLQLLYVDDGSSVISEEVGESSARGANRGNKESTCIACCENVPFVDIARCPCSHEYCRHCITELFQSCILDESLFPPRCCGQPIPLGLNQIFLPSRVVGEFRAKEMEYRTPNRTYCHEPSCSTFVPPQFIQDEVAACVKCRRKTCVKCKGSSHDEDCPEDPVTQEVLRIASENGWQRCKSCHRMVELSTGCYHITCLCRAEFCYVCGLDWKTCPCHHWDEGRLLDRAQNIADRIANGREMNAARRADLVNRQRRNLLANHECAHELWARRSGEFRCEECRHLLPSYIFECRNCFIMACHQCRFNRL